MSADATRLIFQPVHVDHYPPRPRFLKSHLHGLAMKHRVRLAIPDHSQPIIDPPTTPPHLAEIFSFQPKIISRAPPSTWRVVPWSFLWSILQPRSQHHDAGLLPDPRSLQPRP